MLFLQDEQTTTERSEQQGCLQTVQITLVLIRPARSNTRRAFSAERRRVRPPRSPSIFNSFCHLLNEQVFTEPQTEVLGEGFLC